MNEKAQRNGKKRECGGEAQGTIIPSGGKGEGRYSKSRQAIFLAHQMETPGATKRQRFSAEETWQLNA